MQHYSGRRICISFSPILIRWWVLSHFYAFGWSTKGLDPLSREKMGNFTKRKRSQFQVIERKKKKCKTKFLGEVIIISRLCSTRAYWIQFSCMVSEIGTHFLTPTLQFYLERCSYYPQIVPLSTHFGHYSNCMLNAHRSRGWAGCSSIYLSIKHEILK